MPAHRGEREDMEPRSEQLSDVPELLATDLDRYFQQLVLSFQQRLYAFALRQTGNLEDAEDIVQNDKLAWLLVILMLPLLGALMYYFVRRPKRISTLGQ